MRMDIYSYKDLSLLRKVQFVDFQSFFAPTPKGKRLKTNKLKIPF